MSKIIVIKSGAHVHLDPVHSGFAHGFGVFETIKLSAGRLEFWKAHYERFLRSAKAFNLHFDQSEEAVLEAIRELVQAEGLQDGIVKLSLLHEAADSCCYVYTRSMEPPDAHVKLHLNPQALLNEHSLLAGHKTHNYMEAMQLKKVAVGSGFFDVVRLNTAGYLAETAVANLFFVKDGNLRTPALSTGILPGVIRAEVMKIAEKHSISIEEGHYPIEDLKAADAVFLTNSSVGILPVSSVDAADFNALFDVSSEVIETLKVALSQAKKLKSVALTDEPESKEPE